MSNLFNKQKMPKREIKIKPMESLKQEFQSEKMIETETKNAQAHLEQLKQKIHSAEQNKQLLMEETNATIQQAKDNWAREKQAWIEQAKKEGYQAGFEQGKIESLKSYKASIEQANEIVDLVKIDYQKTLEQTEDVIVQLAINTAEKILAEKLNEDPVRFMHIVKAALKEIKNQSVISIYLHPANYELVLEQKAELKRILENDTKLSIYVDDDLEETSCIIEHPFGQIDASIDTQLEQIRSALNELVMESKQ